MGEGRYDKPRAILIAGATGSGKSRLGRALARARNGVVINADSMQVYAELRILTGRPSLQEEASCAHRLYGHVGLGEAYSVGTWLEEVEKVIKQVRVEGRAPIVVGGTGLYFRALCEGLAPVPEVSAEIRAYWRRQAAARSSHELFSILKERDGQMAQVLRPSDRQRIARALEVIDGTGRSLAEWQREAGVPGLAPGTFTGLVVSRPRAETYAACEKRFDEMVEGGALAEAAFVRDMQLDASLPGMRALGLAPLISYLDGEILLEEAVWTAKRDTRRYVKRQETWLRRNMLSWNYIIVEDMEQMLVNSFAFIDG